MDCPSEENLIRMALGGLTGVGPMTFDLAHRQLRVVHSGEPARIAQKLTPLNLGAVLLTSERRTEGGQWKTRFSVPKMDCPSEENLIRMALADASAVAALDFDLAWGKYARAAGPSHPSQPRRASVGQRAKRRVYGPRRRGECL